MAAGVLLSFRWPLFWLPHAIHPDESQLLAGAITLRHDPVFWRSVDGGTAGPLDFCAVLPATFFHGLAAFAAARCIAAGLIWGMLVFTGEAIARLTTTTIGRLAIIPVLLFEAFTTSPEFFHYSTELVPGFLFAAALYVLVAHYRQPSSVRVWLFGLLAGAVPLAKLQGVPLATALVVTFTVVEIQARRRSFLLHAALALLTPTAVTVLGLLATAQLGNATTSYVLQNIIYTQSGRAPFFGVLADQWAQSVVNGYLAWLLASSAVTLTVALVILAARKAASAAKFFFAALFLLGMAVSGLLAPGRPYHHYFNLIFSPLTLAIAGALAVAEIAWPRPKIILGAFFLLVIFPPIVRRAGDGPDPYLNYNLAGPKAEHQALVSAVRKFSQPGEALGIWGWRSELYVETSLRQATRQAHSEAQIISSPSQAHFLRTYLEDIRANNPPVFVDAVGAGNFRFQDRRYAHEAFRPLREWIDQHYRQVADLDGARIYVRNDRLAEVGVFAPTQENQRENTRATFPH